VSRQPGPPPRLPGYTYVKLLGLGGFADVFLYEQQMPRQQVAVKVLTDDVVNETVREQFHAEANLMAQVSAHPSIVSVYQADIAEDGRPYLVMEYCPGDNLWVRYRRERFDVPEALRIGVRLASAVEVAHRTGILHRDIKPANVLTTAYDWPKLTDFGIASATGQISEAAGMSVPWSPPETFADPPTGDERADVWALGATVYTLLAGRSPFEQPGASNTTLDLIDRIEKNPLPPIGRDDVPAKLEQVLARSMAKRPVSRFARAIDLARALQEVEIQLQLAPTKIEVPKTAPERERHDGDEDAGHTRIRNLATITPQATPQTSAARTVVRGDAGTPAGAETAVAGATIARPATGIAPEVAGRPVPSSVPGQRSTGLPTPVVAETVHRPVAEPPEEVTGEAPSNSRRSALLAAAAALVAAVAIVAPGGDETNENAPPTAEQQDGLPDDATVTFVPAPSGLVAGPTAGGTAFSWTNDDPQEGDTFLWRRTDPGADSGLRPVEEPSVVVPAEGRVCIEVLLVRSNARSSEPSAEVCTP
jgi:hypothetical protein